MNHRWDPERYLRFADERGRPYLDLLARIEVETPTRVVDLGCGPGNLTALLADRWPGARISGIDSSPEMIDRAAQEATAGGRIDYAVGDLRDWQPAAPVDVIVSNATLQWLPDHLDLLPGLVDHLAPGGALAFQVPGNFRQPSHTLLHELAGEPRYAGYTTGVARPSSRDPQIYATALLARGLRVDAWETTYLHLLTGPDPVFTWISGTGARPVLQALPDQLREEFVAEYKRRLRAAYPATPYGTQLPFRRVFVVAHR